MRVVCLLFRLGARPMAWFGSWFGSCFFPVCQWLWRRLLLVWRCFSAVGMLSRLPLRDRQEDGSKNDSGRKYSDSGSEGGSPEGVEATVDPQEAPGGQGAGKRARHEEEEREEPTDEWCCGYDSTWEEEESEERTPRWPGSGSGSRPRSRSRPSAASRNLQYNFARFERAARDMQNYRRGYPGQVSPQYRRSKDSDTMPNLQFYLGRSPSEPDGVYIRQFHEEWRSQYDTLEYVHTYIQWLFPLQEPGMNHKASPLTREEVQEFCRNEVAKKNLLESYKLMLDFYGISLRDERTGEVERAPNWRERFSNLNSHTHNSLRITRILKCLGTLGYEHYQAPLAHFFLHETLVNGELPAVKESVLSYFLFAVLDKGERRKLLNFAYVNYDRKDEFVWCPKKVQMLWSQSKQNSEKRGPQGPSLESFRVSPAAEETAKQASQSEASYYI